MPKFLSGGAGRGSNMSREHGAIPGVDGANVAEQVAPGGKSIDREVPVREQGSSASTGGYRADPGRASLPSAEECSRLDKQRGAHNERDGRWD